MQRLKIRRVGNSLGVVLPKETLERLKATEGDFLYLTDGPDNGYRLTPYNEEFARQMELAEALMREDRDLLRELAKR